MSKIRATEREQGQGQAKYPTFIVRVLDDARGRAVYLMALPRTGTRDGPSLDHPRWMTSFSATRYLSDL